MLLYAAWWGYTQHHRSRCRATPDAVRRADPGKGQLTTAQVYIKVFNGGNSRGLAGDVGPRPAQQGLQGHRRSTNTVEKIGKTVIVGAGAKTPRCSSSRRFFKGAMVRADGRSDHSVDVLVGNKYGGFNKNAKATYVVETPTVCLPSQAQTRLPRWAAEPPADSLVGLLVGVAPAPAGESAAAGQGAQPLLGALALDCRGDDQQLVADLDPLLAAGVERARVADDQRDDRVLGQPQLAHLDAGQPGLGGNPDLQQVGGDLVQRGGLDLDRPGRLIVGQAQPTGEERAASAPAGR